MRPEDDDRKDLDLESPLGLTDGPVRQNPEDHLVQGSHASRRRRARALGEDGIERPSTGLDDLNTEHDGATGIDMGYGGSGTDIKGS